MKYMMMVLASQADYDAQSGKGAEGIPEWSQKDLQAMFDHMGAINNDLAESGELIDAQGLAEPAQTRLISRGKNGVEITDGPYGETKEMLAGYWLLDCASFERVTEIAARVLECPTPANSPDYPIVVRPIGEVPDTVEG